MFLIQPTPSPRTEAELAEQYDLPSFTRRQALLTLGGAAAAALVGCSGDGTTTAAATTSSNNCVVESNVTRGPYFVDTFTDSNNVASSTTPYAIDALIPQRSDVRTDTEGSTGTQAGVTLALTVTLYNGSCGSVLTGARVDIWHANTQGIYSDINATGNGTGSYLGQDWLRGYQVSDANGQVTFTTIYPGAYSGRAPHIHLKIRVLNGTTVMTEATTQLFFTDAQSAAVYAGNTSYSTASYNTKDAQDQWYAAENPVLLPTLTGSVSAGFTATIAIGVAVGTIAAGN